GNELAREIGGASGAFGVGRLAPPLPAADHPAGHHRQRPVLLQPRPDEAIEGPAEIAVGHTQDTRGRVDPVEGDPVAPHQPRAKLRRTPVDGDEGGIAAHALSQNVAEMPPSTSMTWPVT